MDPARKGDAKDRQQDGELPRLETEPHNGRLHRGGGFCHARCFPKFEVGLQIEHHFPELAEIERLRAIADGLLRRRMHFHQKTIGPNRDGGARKRGNQLRLPVAWLGSRTTGRWVSSLRAATAVMSQVLRVAVSKCGFRARTG